MKLLMRNMSDECTYSCDVAVGMYTTLEERFSLEEQLQVHLREDGWYTEKQIDEILESLWEVDLVAGTLLT